MAVRGSTPEERKVARAKVRRERRIKFYRDLITATPANKTRLRLAYACDFLRAVGDELGDEGRTDLARKVAALAEEGSKP